MRIELSIVRLAADPRWTSLHPTLSNDGFEVARAEPAAGHDGDPVASVIDQFRESLDSLEGRRPAARGQHAFDAQGDQDIEGLERVRGLVKCLVERDAQRPGQSDELGGLVAVDRRASVVKTPSTTPAAPSVLATSMSWRMTAISGSE